jgi:hypothetical protein
MQLISSRIVPFIDTQSLESGQAREVLFRDRRGFVLYLSDGDPSRDAEERVIALELREALIWAERSIARSGGLLELTENRAASRSTSL